MRLNPLRGAAPRFITLFALISLVAIGLMTGSVLLLDHEARRSRAEEAARRDLGLIAAKLKGGLGDPEAGPLIAALVHDVDAYAGTATGRTLRFVPAGGAMPSTTPSASIVSADEIERAGVSLNAPAGTLTVSRAVEPSGPLRPAFIRYGGFAGALAVVLAILAGLLVSRSLTERVAAINAVLAAAAGGASGRRAGANEGPIEFRILARNLNAMLDTLEHRLVELRLASDRMAHDLRTPLTRIAARLATIDASDDPTARDSAGRARGEIDTLVATLNALLDLREIETESRLEYDRLRLDLAIRDVIELYEAEAVDVHGIIIEIDLPEIEIIGSRPLIVRAVANLIDNALRAAPRGSVIWIGAALIGDRARVEIRDAGPGFPAALATDLERGATLRSAWNGNGLGLTIVHAIARRHGGTIAFSRDDDKTVATFDIAAG